jgi:hypothetical protein
MCKTAQIKLQGIIRYNQRVARTIHDPVEIGWDPEEKPSFGTYNPSLLG